MISPDLHCFQVVDLVTEFLSDALDAEHRERFERHLGECEDCVAALRQFQATIAISGRLRPADVDRVDPETRHRLIEAMVAASATRLPPESS